MNWNEITSIEDLQTAINSSFENPVMIFKHSKRCGTSFYALNFLQSQWKNEEVKNLKPYMLDLVSYREISDKISKEFSIKHESPQVLLIKNGECIYNDSHGRINYYQIKKFIE
jgi:bacillithiol system protein YtxJ